MKPNRQKEARLSLERLKELLDYNQHTGLFIRKIRVANFMAGSTAGSFYRYCNISIDGEYYGAHRLAFFYMTGRWPIGEIDHINGNKLDNKWKNLRDVSKSVNTHSRPKQKNNTSGYKGVQWNKFAKKWTASIMINKTVNHLGYFNTAYEAHLAYEAAAFPLREKRAA